MHTKLRLGVATLLVATASIASAATTGLKYVSTSGDYIGQGLTQTYLPPTATITGTANGNTGHVYVSDPANWWSLDFASPSGTTLAKGSYAATQRYPFQSPMGNGLDFSGDGRGCNQSRGWFRIREYAVDTSGNIKKLALDYLQNCEIVNPPLYGAVRINSSLPLVVPMTAAIAGNDFGVIAGRTATLDGSQSFSRRKGGITYQWTQLDGPAVTLSSNVVATPTFTAPDVPLEGGTLHFSLTVTDATGATDTDDVAVVVNSASAPRTSADFYGDAGDYITLGNTYHYDTNTAQISFSRNYDGGVSVSVSGDTWWYFDTATKSGTTYRPGAYTDAQRFPFQDATHPGLSLDGDGRGCNTLKGAFRVWSVTFDNYGTPTSADITFDQHCEGGTAASYGEFLLNAVPHATLQAQLKAARVKYPRQ